MRLRARKTSLSTTRHLQVFSSCPDRTTDKKADIGHANCICSVHSSLSEGVFLHENIYCGYSLGVPRRNASNKYQNVCFRGEIQKIPIMTTVDKSAFPGAMSMIHFLMAYVVGMTYHEGCA